MSHADRLYGDLIADVWTKGEHVRTRNSGAYRLFAPDVLRLDTFPLIQLRRTAWKKALLELQWFMSGDSRCPAELTDWWTGQLNPHGDLVHGYPWQLRAKADGFDQVAFVLEALRNNPYSRRILMTTWNPGEMADITTANQNPNTPTTCHGTMLQYSVSPGLDGKPETLNAYHFQRSADVLLGLPHNLVQHWALLTFFATHAGLEVGTLTYQLGDAHIYDEQSHVQVAQTIIKWAHGYSMTGEEPRLVYSYGGEVDSAGLPAFKANDFTVVWPEGATRSEPITTIRPKLL